MTKTKIIQTLSTLLSFILLSLYIWNRFIRVRVPKEIPFKLTEIGFILIVTAIILYAFSIYSLVYKSKSKTSEMGELVKYINNFIYKPFSYILVNAIAYFPEYFSKYFRNFIEYIIQRNLMKLYLFTYIIPRLLFVTVLTIDVLYFHYIHYAYIIILLGITLLCYRIVLYLIKFLLKNNLDYIDYCYEIACWDLTNNQLTFVKSDVITKVLALRIMRNLPLIDYSLIINIEFLERLQEQYNISPKVRIESVIDLQKIEAQTFTNITLFANVQVILMSFDKALKEYIVILLSINMLYIICWSYILVVSLSSLSPFYYLPLVCIITPQDIEPFSGLLL